jgi:sulfite reductase alpha subunit-like flavoprotein
MRDRAADVGQMLRDDNTYIYVCGLKGMEGGVLQALRDIAEQHGIEWDPLWRTVKRDGRLHLETY